MLPLSDNPQTALIVGAGVVGLAVARELALRGYQVNIYEAETSCGQHTSGRNSEIIHSGLYYQPHSLKARLCREGRQLLYTYCRQQDVPHQQLGKLIVACTDHEISKLRQYQQNGHANSTPLEWMEASEAQRLEPALRCTAALWSPTTGIVDGHRLMQALLQEAQQHGAKVHFQHRLLHGSVTGPGLKLSFEGPGRRSVTATADVVVNCAGLHAQQAASCLQGMPAQHVPASHLARGCYFQLKVPSPFRHLVYPLPEQGGLGVHLTLDLHGGAKFGPDVQWVDEVDYAVDGRSSDAFYQAIRTYWPGLPDGALEPSYAGIRPKVSGPGEPGADFIIQGRSVHGVPGLVNLFGIESPGLTSCLAIAEHVAGLLASESRL